MYVCMWNAAIIIIICVYTVYTVVGGMQPPSICKHKTFLKSLSIVPGGGKPQQIIQIGRVERWQGRGESLWYKVPLRDKGSASG